MNIERQHEHVKFYHFDSRNFEFEARNGTPETRINVQLHILEDRRGFDEADTPVSVTLSALIVFESFVLSASLDQISIIKDQLIKIRENLSQEDMKEIADPLFDLLKRLTYELTEVALDEPGLKLEF